MKKLFLLVAIMAMVLPSCKKINEELDALGARLDKLEQETIPSIDEQISAINTTLGNLDAVDKELKGYIDNLTTTASSLQEQINATNSKIEEVKTALQGEISTAKAEVLAELEALESELKNELATINTTIDALKAKDTELDNKIAELRSYVDNELGKTTDWVNATFATLEQYNSLVSEIATIKEQIKAINQSITNLETRLTTKINEDIANAVSTLNADIQQKVSEITTAYTTAIKSAKEEIAAAYTSAIQNAINALDVSLKAWVGEQLSNYYTIAEVEAKITALQTAITDGDATLQEELSKLKSQLKTTATEITAAYKKAIEEAINTNNGVIDTKIANEIASVNQRITNEVATINAKIAEIESRLDNVEAKIAELLARIQSVSYIPEYADGKVLISRVGATSSGELSFRISPKDAVVELEKVWSTALSCEAFYPKTRAVSLVKLAVTEYVADAESGVITVTISGEGLSDEFFAGAQEAKVALVISDGNNQIVSDYAPMVGEEIVDEIWYITIGEQPLAPNKEGVDIFGVNIVSNTYANGKGVIKFDGPVTSIGERAFYGCSRLTSITIPDSVTSIGNYAFIYCTSLTSITIGNSVTEIGGDAFRNCTLLTSVTIPNSNTSIGSSAFYACSRLTSITIGNGVTSIGDEAFYNCDSLTSVTIPDSVTSIGEDAFCDCTSLTAFYSKYASADNRCLIVDGVLTSFAPAGLTEYTIPDSVTTIGEDAFFHCTSLTSVTIPDSVTKIGAEAFRYCNSLISVIIPDSVTSIGDSAFAWCTSLTSVTIGNSVTLIGDEAFYNCTSLTRVNITDLSAWCKINFGNSSANPLCNGAKLYLNGSELTDITIPSDITKIKDYAFFGCSSLISVTIPDSVTSIGTYAFECCSSLTSITIPDSVTSIGGSAFADCTSLTSVYCRPTTPPAVYYRFEMDYDFRCFPTNSWLIIYVPRESYDLYTQYTSYSNGIYQTNWSRYKSYVQPYDFE